MNKIHITAPAKLNLSLEVVKKYDNGFHELRSIMLKSQKIYDDIDVVFDENTDGITIECDHVGVPKDETNICHKIAQKYFEKIGKRIGIHITINKKIPPLTGLGGGSSDGGSVLLVLNEYFDNTFNSDQLIEIAASVGKDIPFFLQDAFAAEVGGAGEKVESIYDFPQLPILLVNPGGEISTPWAYRQLDEKLWFMNDERRKNMTGMMKKSKDTIDDIVPFFYNDFILIAGERYPIINEIRMALRVFGARATSISGKGPTVFGVFDSVEEVEYAKEILKKHYPEFFIAQY